LAYQRCDNSKESYPLIELCYLSGYQLPFSQLVRKYCLCLIASNAASLLAKCDWYYRCAAKTGE
jgi:hypothetical protein